ncbi:MAG: hypothetical protein KGI25_00165 [Thaumarchaeota archaeon]|nr:hypothetical protein [Nitrososphaerota archaeon]
MKNKKENKDVPIYLPAKTIALLREEFSLKEDTVENFVNSLINKTVQEHMDQRNSAVFSKDETKEIEDDLKGLGYI